MRRIVLLIFILANITTAFADNIDTLLYGLNKNLSDSAFAKQCILISTDYLKQDNLVMALDYAVKAEKASLNGNYSSGLADSYFLIGSIYLRRDNYTMALKKFLQSAHYTEGKDSKFVIVLFKQIGKVYGNISQFDNSIIYYRQSLDLSRQLGDTILMAEIYGCMGEIFTKQGKYDKALLKFYNSLRLSEVLNSQEGIARAYKNIGLVYFYIANYEQSLVNLERSLKYYRLNNNKESAEILFYIGRIYEKHSMISKSINYYKKSNEYYKLVSDTLGMATSLLYMGVAEMDINHIRVSLSEIERSCRLFDAVNDVEGVVNSKLALAKCYLKTGSTDKARQLLDSILPVASNHGLLIQSRDIALILSDIYLEKKDYYRATKYLTQVQVLSDSICNKSLKKELAKIRMQTDFDKSIQREELNTIKSTSEHQLQVQKIKMVRNIVIAISILLLIVIFLIYKKSVQIRLKNQLLSEHEKQIEQHIVELEKQKQELEKANYTKNRFLSIIGHDLRNPFNAINSFVAMATEHPEIMDKDHIDKYLRLIREAGANANSLLDNLLEWAKTQSGNIIAEIHPVPVNYILRGNLLLIQESAKQKNIILKESLDGNPIVLMDKNMINTVVRNLLSNAIKFTPEGGEIEIKTVVKKGEIKIVVRDSGIGMSDEQLINLFEPGIIKKGQGGVASSGLGLLLCKEFLSLHRQELRVDSKVNLGTTFWFYLPVKQ